jgi:Gpi18-like mannosyltransferase
VLAAVRAVESPTAARFAAAGILLGLSTLARQNALLFAPLFSIWALAASAKRMPIPRSAALLAVFLLATALTIAPATLRNLYVSGDPCW